MNKWDVIVVGAGPAGATAARICAAAGQKILIIDKYSFPRDKACGGGLSLGAVKELDLEIPEYLIDNTCYGLRSRFQGREAHIGGELPVAYMINRKDFDHFLLKRAIQSGAQFATEKCLSVREFSDRVTVETDKGNYECSICIGADGFSSRTARAVRGNWTKKETRFCLVSTIAGPGKDKDSVELDFGCIPYGYGWLFPKSGTVSAGIGGFVRSGQDLKKNFGEFLTAHGLKPSEPVKGCFIPVSNLRHKIHTKRIMLVGDAAGFADSFSGEGIKNAVISGRIAGEIAIDYLKGTGRVSCYKRKIYSAIASDLIWSRRISEFSNCFEKMVFGNLLSNKYILKKYFQVIRGEKSYRSFFWNTLFAFPFILLKNIILSSFINR